MEESLLFPLEKNSVKPGTVLIESVSSGDHLYLISKEGVDLLNSGLFDFVTEQQRG